MKSTHLIVGLVLVLLAGFLVAWEQLHHRHVHIHPELPTLPSLPAPPPCPPCPHPEPSRPWGPRSESSVDDAGAVVIDGPTHAGQAVQCDLPTGQRIKNIGSRIDGAGMCVMSSIEMAARYAGLEGMRGLRDWCAQQPGGGYPEKVDKQIKAFCAAKGIPVPGYAQYTGAADMDALRQVLGGNRIGCGTYDGHDGVRYRGGIAHMVCIVSDANGQVAILDNNYIQDNELLWMSESDFQSRWGGHNVWLFVWINPGAIPAPS